MSDQERVKREGAKPMVAYHSSLVTLHCVWCPLSYGRGSDSNHRSLAVAALILLRGERLLGAFGQVGKPALVAHGQVRENLAVELDTGLLQAVNEPVVREFMLARGRSD